MHKLFEIPSFTLFLCAFCAFSWPYSSCSSCLRGEKIREISVNPWLINDLRLFKALYNCRDTSTTVMDSLQIRLFMQNKAKFRKSQVNVNKVLTNAYEERTLGEHGKNEPKTNPNEPKTNPNSKRPK